jgi:DNA-binding transcriptional LysR family regulator
MANIQDLELRVVRYVVELARAKHFGRAAAALHISQQSLSAQIAKLEQKLGVTLFVRDRRHVEITEAGRLLATKGESLIRDAQDLLEGLGKTRPPLRLAIIAEGDTSDILARYIREKLPEIDLEVLYANGFASAVTRLGEGRIDIAFGRIHSPSQLSRKMEHGVVRLMPMGVALPPRHPLAKRERVSLRSLRQYPLLSYVAPEALEWEDWTDRIAEEFSLVIDQKLRGHGGLAANAAVVTYRKPAFAALDSLRLDNVVIRPLVDPVPVFEWSIAWRRDRVNDTLVEALEAVRNVVEELQWLEPPRERWWTPVNG